MAHPVVREDLARQSAWTWESDATSSVSKGEAGRWHATISCTVNSRRMSSETLLREKSLAVRFIMERIAIGDLLIVFPFIVMFVVFVVIKVVQRLALGIIDKQVLRRLSGGSFNLDRNFT